MLDDFFKDKKILITGHTGFKGSWLSCWFKLVGAKVSGISLPPSTKPSHFDELDFKDSLDNHYQDIRDFEKLNAIIKIIEPDFIFHLAAQPLVGEAYNNPIKTYETNFIGTLNVLESLRNLEKKCTAILITSDKCYENKEWIWGYKETDDIGGIDPYSASKGACEIMIRSHVKSFFSKDNLKKIGIGRAGNVIGGGDWSEKRIVPDAVKAWAQNKTLELRNPFSTRPWQHVLEPLSGYIKLAILLDENKNIHGEPFNFGPPADQNYSVGKLIEEMSKYWEGVCWTESGVDKNQFHEAGLLKLNCDKAFNLLNWSPTLNFSETVQLTTEWYKNFYDRSKSIRKLTEEQIQFYQNRVVQNITSWK